MIRLRSTILLAATAGLLGLSAPAAQAAEPIPTPPLVVEVVEAGLTLPWAMTFLPDGSMLYTQRDAKTVTLRTTDGQERVVLNSPPGMWNGDETGLMGIEKSVDFDETGLFFTCHGYRSGSTKDVRVVAWKLNAERTEATFAKNLVTGLPSNTGRHAGCALEAGSGYSLYIGTGDAKGGTNPQKLTSGGGKVLRVSSPTGNGYSSNPYASSKNTMQKRVWTFGHRNVQGLARDDNGRIWSVEHGSYRDDEVNALNKKGNYGWNPVSRKKGDPSYNEGSNSPMTDYAIPGSQRGASWSSGNPTVATSGATFVRGEQWGGLNGALAVATLKGQELRFFTFDLDSFKLQGQATPVELDGLYGRLRGVEQGPDGALYVTTSNGSDDKILKITPASSAG